MRIGSCMQIFMTEHQKQVDIETNYVIVGIRTKFEGVVNIWFNKPDFHTDKQFEAFLLFQFFG